MIRRLVISAAAATLAAMALTPTTAQAWPMCPSGYGCEYDWWADAAHTYIAGWMIVDCDGNSSGNEVHTPYLVFHQYRCNT